MQKLWFRFCSMLLVMVMVINMLPMQTFAAELTDDQIIDMNTDLTEEEVTSGQIVAELVDKRTEYTKQFRMDNGLFIASVYNEPVHYEKDGQWAEIDNTLKAQLNGTYTNTAGVWNVSFPNQLTENNEISVTKGSYTLSFTMDGELRTSGDLEVMSAGNFASPAALTEDTAAETFAVTQAQASTAQLETVDIEAIKAEAEHPEMVADKLASGLMYSNVYGTTDIRYQLISNKVKESVILESYSSTLRGYRYLLEVGDMNPVLQDDGSIHFYDAENEEIVMVMEAPFLVDNNMEFNYDIQVRLTGVDGVYLLTYLLPTAWLASSDRVWPVVLDPVISATLSESNIRDQTVASNASYSYTRGINECGYSVTDGKQRFFLKYCQIPPLTSSDVVVNAQISMYKYVSGTTATVQVHKVLGAWESESITWANKPNYDTTVEDYQVAQAERWYTWDVTDIVRGWYETANYGMMFRVNDEVENGTTDNWKQFISADYSANVSLMPQLYVEFRNNNGLESYWDYTTSSAGRAGTGYVNNFTGNLVWTRSDIGFGGNRMPVSISHVYNLNDAGNNEFGFGYGWRTNYNQLVYLWPENNNYYVWEDADGTDHYFKYASTNTYKDEDGLELTLTVAGSGENTTYTITDKQGNTSRFDYYGRLVELKNNQQIPSSINITYSGTTKQITKITDGVNREYDFYYDPSTNLVASIRYMGNPNRTDPGEITRISFGYEGSDLKTVTDKDGLSCSYTYNSSHGLLTAQDVDGYTVKYTYCASDPSAQANTAQWQPYRVEQIAVLDGTTPGGTLNFAYSHNQTVLTDHNGNVEIMQFNDYGDTISIHDGQGRAQYAEYALNNASEAAVATENQRANQLTLSSRLQNTVVNHIRDTSFELYNSWTSNSQYVTVSTSAEAAYMGNQGMKLTTVAGANSLSGAYSNTLALGVGETVTFSAYVKTTSADVSVALHYYDGAEYHTVSSAKVTSLNTWSRAEVSFTNNTGQAQNVCAYVFTPNAGTTYVDCTQLEKTAAASRYNLVDNGDFQNSSLAWSSYDGRVLLTDSDGNTLPSGAPQMDSYVYKLVGSPTAQKRVSQTVNISGAANDTFVFAGWAKGNSVPLGLRDGYNRQFAIQMRFNYTDGSTSDYFTAQFNCDSNEWQYVAAAAIAGQAYSSVTVLLVYDYNMNTVYFDGIQLFKEEFGSSFTYDADGNIISSKDSEGETTAYSYDGNGNITKAVLPTGVTTEYTYDTYNNVLSVTIRDVDEGPIKQTQTFTYDAYGNLLTETTTSGGISMTTTMEYTADDKNRLQSTTDAAGNTTYCWYNAQTNVLEWIQYPGDTVDDPYTDPREGTATYYGYDDMYRQISASAVAAEDASVLTGEPILFANYTFNTEDQLTAITTGSTTYNFEYGVFSLRNKVEVGSTTLATYNYTDDQNKYLEELAYSNGDSIQYEYDKYGRVTKQTYEDSDTVTYQYDNDGALASVYDSATGITTKSYYDFTGRTGATELRKNADLIFRVSGNFDEYGRLTSQSRQYTSQSFTDTYTYNPSGTLQGMVLGNLRGIGFTYDGFDRITAMNTGDDGVNGRTFTYRVADTEGTQTTSQIAELKYHEIGNKPNKSALIFSYEYDNRGNIEKYTAPGEDKVKYIYDTQNQLISVRKDADNSILYSYTYDDAGNITQAVKNGVTSTYTYGNSDWGDLLTAYNGTTIGYDAYGNPTSYYNGWNFSWEHGREMVTATKSGQSLSFTYGYDGLRTTKTVNGVVYTYYYSGGKLMRLTYTGNTLDFFYDQNGHPFMLLQNSNIYYYITNAQGDVIRLVDINGNTAASYRYDPYGKAISALGSHATINPLRYRGYVFDHETGLYYLQSRYYDPEIGRFINADAYACTGQGLIGNNMFAYCGNNPVILIDCTGLNWQLCVRTDLHGGGAGAFVGGVIGVGAGVALGVGLYDFVSNVVEAIDEVIDFSMESTYVVNSNTIDWQSGDRNHILKGTRKKHVPGWERFGIDPNNSNNHNWTQLLPILYEVVDDADDQVEYALSGGAKYIKYIKTYVEIGVKVVVKIWVSPDGSTQKLSDAIPYIIDG